MRADAGGGAAAPVKENAAKDAIVPVDITDSWIVGSDRMAHDAGAAGAKNNRTFFDKVKGAFRSGYVSGTHWDDVNVGGQSSGFGINPTASGEASHAEGINTTASASYSHAEGNSTTASGSESHAEGISTTASGPRSHAEGVSTTASGYGSHAQGLYAVASRYGQHAFGTDAFAAPGDAQASSLVVQRQTADAAAAPLMASTTLTLTGANTSVLTIPARSAFQVTISAVARRTDVQGEMAGFTWEGLVGRDATGNARIIGSPVTKAWSDTAATAWAMGVAIDTTDATNNYVRVTGTGEAGKTIRWVARMEWTEVAG